MDERIKVVEGAMNARGVRFGIAASRFNELVVDRLLRSAVGTLTQHGAEPGDVEVLWVPGAFELPLALKRMARSRKYDALIALGCVIRGQTPHFDYVAGQAAHGIAAVSLEHEIPIGFGVLTVETVEQALERAGTKAGNKGADAAMTAIEMASLARRMEQ